MVLEYQNSIIPAGDLRNHLFSLYAEQANRKGLSTGFASFDNVMRLNKGFLHVVTGIPGCGKSEVVDAIAVNTTLLHDWKWCFYSPENFPIELHLMKLIEKYVGKNKSKLTKNELLDAYLWASDHFTWIYPKEGQGTDLDSILSLVDQAGEFDAVVIDPWGEVDSSPYSNLSETEYIKQSLSKTRKFARQRKQAFFIVAHPTKLQKDKDGRYPIPDGYSISGSAHWRNLSDMLFVVHREDPNANKASVYVGKVKQKDYGMIGMCTLDYDYASGRFKDEFAPEYILPTNEIESPF